MGAGVVFGLLEARYYNGKQGRFISQDPTFWELPIELLLDPQLNNSGRTMGRWNGASASGWNGNTKSRAGSMSGWAEFLADPQMQNSYSYGRNNPISMSDPDGKFPAAVLPALAVPGVGEVIVGGAILVGGTYAIYEGTKAIVNSFRDGDWGSRYDGQVQTINEKTSGLNQAPLGPEDWEPKNLGNFPKWVKYGIGGGIIGATIKEFISDKRKEALESAKNFKENSQSKSPIQSKKPLLKKKN